MEGIRGLEITIARGRPVLPLPDGDRYLGLHVRARGERRRGRALAARRARPPADPDRTARARAGPRALAWVTRARAADLDLRAGPPAVARRLAGGRAAPRRPRGPLPGSQRGAVGPRRAGVDPGGRLLGADAHRHAPGAQRRPASAPRASRATDLLLRTLRHGQPPASGA